MFKKEGGLFKNKYRVKSARREGYDYSLDGVYFITICLKNFKLQFGQIKDGAMILSPIGRIADKFWREIPKHFLFVELDEFVVMPNHLHGILIIKPHDSVETRHGASLQQQGVYKNKFGPLQKNSLALIINHFKGSVKRWCSKNNFAYFSWQSRFYDRIIRDEEELSKARQYIIDNPLKRDLDKNNPKNIKF